MTVLGQLRNAKRFVLVGLCSGAYLAYHTTVADARGSWGRSSSARSRSGGGRRSGRADRAPGLFEPLFYARAILDRKVWLRAMRGEVQVKASSRALPPGTPSDQDERRATAVDRALARRSRASERGRGGASTPPRATEVSSRSSSRASTTAGST